MLLLQQVNAHETEDLQKGKLPSALILSLESTQYLEMIIQK